MNKNWLDKDGNYFVILFLGVSMMIMVYTRTLTGVLAVGFVGIWWYLGKLISK